MEQHKEMRFWLTCPGCRRKFGVPPVIVLKYVDRLLDGLGDRMAQAGRRFAAQRPQPAPPENLPVG